MRQRFPLSVLPLLLALVIWACEVNAQEAPARSVDLGNGSVTLDGPWQFRLGDDPSDADPALADATGVNGWEAISTESSWTAQGHPLYWGYGWYRKHLRIHLAPGASADLGLLVPPVRDMYVIYWNGGLVAQKGKFPPHPRWSLGGQMSVHRVPVAGDGVLAIRVFKCPPGSAESDIAGMLASPTLGTRVDMESRKASFEYGVLKAGQIGLALDVVYVLVMVLSLALWSRNRTERVLLYTGTFCAGQLYLSFLNTFYQLIPISSFSSNGLWSTFQSVRDVSLWFLLLWLLELRGTRLARWTRSAALLMFSLSVGDTATVLWDWTRPGTTVWAQLVDAILTAGYTALEVWPVVLLAFAFRKRLDGVRWMVAGFASFYTMIWVVKVAAWQGQRFTHWTLSDRVVAPLFTVAGGSVNLPMVAEAGLLFSIFYAVIRVSRETLERQQIMQQELKSAQELQQILIPSELPSLPGFNVTTAYRPAQEVGGDFFLIVPLEGAASGSTIVVVGDVSGKGLRAAMTVSLIVGALRAILGSISQPSAMLSELSQHLNGRLRGGFVTCAVLRLDPDGLCSVASAGHPAPLLNGNEIVLSGALPLGILPGAEYECTTLRLSAGDHLLLYTDGILEARSASGELFGFDRVRNLSAQNADATQAMEAAIGFGQDDDITVLTLTRLQVGENATTRWSVPSAVPA